MRPATITGFSASTSIFAASSDRSVIAGGWRCQASLGICKFAFGLRDRLLLQFAVGYDHDGLHGRRHGDLVGANGGLGEVRQAKPANHPTWCNREPSTRRPARYAPTPLRCDAMRVLDVAQQKIQRHAIAVSVVNGHGCVLQAHGAVRHHHHRLAFDLEVAMSHGDRRFLVAAGEQLRDLVAAVINQRLVDAAKAGAGISGDVFDAQLLDHVDHEVGTRAVRGPHVDVRRRRSLGGGLLSAGQGSGSGGTASFGRFLRLSGLGFHHQRGSSGGCALQEAATVN